MGISRLFRNLIVPDDDISGCRGFMAGYHSQCGRLAAAGRPEQATIGARWNLEVDGIHSGYAAVPLRKLHQFKRCRGRHPHQSAWFFEDLGDFRRLAGSV